MILAIGFVGTMVALAALLQIRLMDIAHEAPSLAAASNHAAFNPANAPGPWLGGMAITAGLDWTRQAIQVPPAPWPGRAFTCLRGG